jgi:hypothetical protein
MKLSPELLLEHCDKHVLKTNFDLEIELQKKLAFIEQHRAEPSPAWLEYLQYRT